MKRLLQTLFISLFTLSSFATVHQIEAGMFFYEPNTLTIALGDTVEWINAGGNHDVNGDINTITEVSFENPESFSSTATNVQGATIYTHVFNLAGTYNYDCSVGNHALQGMTGSITVEGGDNGTIVDIVVNSDIHTILESAVVQAGLVDALNGSGPLTLFAPTDSAFNLLPEGTLEAVLADNDILTSILLHHVHDGYETADNLTDGMEIPTLNEDILTVSVNGTEVMIDMATVTVTNVIADNGIVHIIDMVLIPETDDLTVMSIIENSPIHTKLEEAIIEAELDNTLDSEGTYTLFAPVDAAFEGLDESTLDVIFANTEVLTNLLLGHVLDEEIYAEDLEDGMTVNAMNDSELTISIDGTTVMINMATVVEANVSATNGVVHFIDMVLLPEIEDVDTTVWSLIEASPIHSTLEAAINAADLAETLSGEGPFTVFAPTNDAFDALPAGALDELLDNIPLLTEILLHHVHSGDVLSTDLSDGMEVPTLNEDILVVTFDGGSVMIDMATVTQADVEADNGVVHMIDAVLIPEDPSGIETLFKNEGAEYLYTINLLGKKVDKNATDKILVDIYSNGTSVKRYNVRK